MAGLQVLLLQQYEVWPWHAGSLLNSFVCLLGVPCCCWVVVAVLLGSGRLHLAFTTGVVHCGLVRIGTRCLAK
jgi:hypothetical protein